MKELYIAYMEIMLVYAKLAAVADEDKETVKKVVSEQLEKVEQLMEKYGISKEK